MQDWTRKESRRVGVRARARFMDLAWDMLAERRGRKDPWEWAGAA